MGPVLEEGEDLFAVVALPVFKVGAVLDMQHSAFLVEHNKGGVAETSRVAEAFHGFVVLVGF